MLSSPLSSPSSRMRLARWKTKLRLLSFNGRLSDSPYSIASGCLPESQCFLTPLEVREPEYFTPLTDHVGKALGDETLPPPPPAPRRKLSYGASLPVPEESRPKVRPFVAASKAPIFGQKCFICGEALETKLECEKLVPLACGDCVHSECLSTATECGLHRALSCGRLSHRSSSIKVEAAIFPTCGGAHCMAHKKNAPVVVIDDDITTTLVDDALLALKLSTVGRISEAASEFTQLDWPDGSEDDKREVCERKIRKDSDSSLLSGKAESIPSRRSDSIISGRHDYDSRSDFRFSRASLFDISEKPFLHRPFLDFKSFAGEKPFERESSPAPSSVTNATVSVRISLHEQVPLDHLKSHFIRQMVESCDEMNYLLLVAVGPLRLVDRLRVSIGENYFEAIVYLFLNDLVICCENKAPQFFSFSKLKHIGSPDFSVLQLHFVDSPISLVELFSDVESIIQKWGIALSDSLLLFPSEIFSSTISLSEVIPDKTSFVAQVSPIWEDNESQETSAVTDKNRDDLSHVNCEIPENDVGPLVNDLSSLVLENELSEIFPTKNQTWLSELLLDSSKVKQKNVDPVSASQIGTYVYSSSPTTPLNIYKIPAPSMSSPIDSDSESESDSDDEAIRDAIRGKLHIH